MELTTYAFSHHKLYYITPLTRGTKALASPVCNISVPTHEAIQPLIPKHVAGIIIIHVKIGPSVSRSTGITTTYLSYPHFYNKSLSSGDTVENICSWIEW